MRILSVAPRYRLGVDGAQGGHYTVYQDDLRGAAARLGIAMTTLAERSVPTTDGVLGALDVLSPDTIAHSVTAVAEAGDLVVVYEGSLAMVAAFVPVAQARPDVRFVVNLFRPEPGLVPAERTGRAGSAGWRVVAGIPAGSPANLVVSAETETRVELARRLGIPCAGAWRLHSTLWDVAVDPDRRPPTAPLRVLVPLADRGYSPDVVRDLAAVLHLLRARHEDAPISLTLTGAGSTKRSGSVRGPRLERLGARRVVGPADRGEYAALFAAHDVIWIPNRTSYRSQSSGKALDALIVGCPVVGFADGWPATEASRWLGEALAYEDVQGAARLLRDLQARVDVLHERLAAQQDRIRAAYAPDSTLLRVLDLAGVSSDGSGTDGRRASEPLPPQNHVLGRAARPRQPATPAAWLVGHRAARIGLLPRLVPWLRGRLWGIRARMRRHGATSGR